MGADLAAAVPFYGNQPSATDAAKIKTPLLAHYAEFDTRITSGWKAFNEALTAAHVMGYTERDPNAQLQVAAFRQQLQKFGWVEGSNLVIDFRYAADDADRIRTLARELLALAPDVMVSNSNLVTTILQSEIHTIPLVFISVSDPVGSGFVTDLARPTGNVTGFANFQPTMGSKWLDILRQIAPHVDHAGLLLHPEPPNFGYLKSAEDAAPSFNIELVSLPVQGQADIESALGTMSAKPNAGLVVAPNAVTFANSNLIIALGGTVSLTRNLSICLLCQSRRIGFLRV